MHLIIVLTGSIQQMVTHQVLIQLSILALLDVVQLKYRCDAMISEQELDHVRRVKFLLATERPLEYLVDHRLRKVQHVLIAFTHDEVETFRADLEASVEEVVPNVLALDLLSLVLSLRARRIPIQLLLAAE